MLLNYHDGKPYALKNVLLNLYTYINYNYNSTYKTFFNKTDINGIIEVDYYVPKNATSFNIEVTIRF